MIITSLVCSSKYKCFIVVYYYVLWKATSYIFICQLILAHLRSEQSFSHMKTKNDTSNHNHKHFFSTCEKMIGPIKSLCGVWVLCQVFHLAALPRLHACALSMNYSLYSTLFVKFVAMVNIVINFMLKVVILSYKLSILIFTSAQAYFLLTWVYILLPKLLSRKA